MPGVLDSDRREGSYQHTGFSLSAPAVTADSAARIVRFALCRRPTSTIGQHELASGVPHAQVINTAFIYTHPLGSRFNDADRGAWYAAF